MLQHVIWTKIEACITFWKKKMSFLAVKCPFEIISFTCWLNHLFMNTVKMTKKGYLGQNARNWRQCFMMLSISHFEFLNKIYLIYRHFIVMLSSRNSGVIIWSTPVDWTTFLHVNIFVELWRNSFLYHFGGNINTRYPLKSTNVD